MRFLWPRKPLHQESPIEVFKKCPKVLKLYLNALFVELNLVLKKIIVLGIVIMVML